MDGVKVAGIVIYNKDIINIDCDSASTIIRYQEGTSDPEVNKIVELSAPHNKVEFF